MPWVRRDKTIYKKVKGRLVKKQTCKSVESAKRALRLLYKEGR
jgi:hypothetical protein